MSPLPLCGAVVMPLGSKRFAHNLTGMRTNRQEVDAGSAIRRCLAVRRR
jgi:hypothetical protein